MDTSSPPAPGPEAPADIGPGHPRHWEADVVASDGAVVHLRPMLPSDADALLQLFGDPKLARPPLEHSGLNTVPAEFP